jgi:hypothetical protein
VGAGEWFVHVRDGRPLHVTAVRPEQLDATLRMDADAYASFVAGESTWAEAIAEAGGAGLAVTLLGRWIERAFGRDELELAREERQRVIQTSRIGSWSAAAGGLHALYADWERERWSVHGLDFAADREQWLATPADAQADLLALIAPVVAGSERLAAGIASLWHVAPSGEAEVLLTTQLADLARAATLHDRFGAEVLALEAAGLRGRIRELNGAVPAAESGFRGFAEGVAECRALARAVSGKRRALLAVLESRGAYPGFARGLAWAERDGLRHEAIAAHFPAPAVPAPAHAPAAAALPC